MCGDTEGKALFGNVSGIRDDELMNMERRSRSVIDTHEWEMHNAITTLLSAATTTL